VKLAAVKYKLFVWHFAILFLTYWLWSFAGESKFNSITGLEIQAPSLAAFIILTSVISLGYLVFREKKWAFTVSLLTGFLFLIQFGYTNLNWIGVLIFFLFNLYAIDRSQEENSQRLKLNIPRMLQAILFPVVLGFFVLISFAAYQSPIANEIKSSQRLPSQSESVFQQIVEKTVGSKIEASNPQQHQKIVNEIANQTFQEFNTFLKPYFQYAPPILAFGLFLILWGLAFLFVWLGVAMGMIYFWVLKKTRIVRIEEKDVKAEVLVV
jgi:hypothetical protein